MTRTVTFAPLSRDEDIPDLAYEERASRDRSLHLLLQDRAPSSSATRRQFLLGAFREVVSRYNGLGRIEHPLALVRGTICFLEGLSRRADCRVDDFSDVGIYMLLRDGDTAYLLASSDGHVRLATPAGFVAPAAPGLSGVRRLPVAAAGAQKELFQQTFRDFLSFYRIERAEAAGPDADLVVVMGGAGRDLATAIEVGTEPGTLSGAGGDTLALGGISRSVLWVAFPPARPGRAMSLPLHPARRSRSPGRVGMAAAAAVMVCASAALVWWGGRRGQEAAPGSAQRSETPAAGADAGSAHSAAQRSDAGLRPRTGPGEARVAARGSDAEDAFEIIAPEIAWRKRYRRAVTTSPVMAGDLVLFGCRDGGLYALDAATGAQRWRYAAGAGIGASPLYVDGLVIACDYGGGVAALDVEDAKPIWRASLGTRISSSPAAWEGEVVVAGYDGIVRGLSAQTGRELWRARTGGRIRGSAVAAEGVFYVPSHDGGLYALARGNGHVRWIARPGGEIESTPAVASARVVVGGSGGLHAYDAASGEALWSLETEGPVNSFVTLVGDRVYAGCEDHRVYCVEAGTGALVWKTETGGEVYSRPLVIGGTVWLGSYDRHLYCLDAETGEVRARLDTGAQVFSSPAAGTTRIYFGNNAGAFFGVEFRRKRAS